MQTVLITGGTGLVGKKLTQTLLTQGYKVIILSRGTSGKQPAQNVSYARWNVKEQEIDIGALQAADHIIHLAGAGVVEKKWTKAYKQQIVDSRTESSRLIFESLRDHPNKVQAVVSASAIGWYGADTGTEPFTEEDPPAADFLGNTCKLWEQSIEPVITLGKRLVKLRTGIVLAKEGGALVEFKKPLKLGTAAILGSGKQMVSWIHMDDLCRMFIAAIENKNMQGTYNAVASVPVTNKELTITLAKAMNGRSYIPIHVPAFVLNIMMGQRSIEVLKSATVSNKKIIDTGFDLHFEKIEDAMNNLLKKD